MQELAGTLALENKQSELDTWEKLKTYLNGYEGVLGYKYPSVGVSNKLNIPTVIIISKSFGILLIDIIDNKIQSLATESEQDKYWLTEDNLKIYSRDIVLDDFAEDIKARLRKYSNLYDRRNDKLIIPINKILLFYQHTEAENTLLVQKMQSQEYELFNSISTMDSLNRVLEDIISSNRVNISDSHYKLILSVLESDDKEQDAKHDTETNKFETKNDFIRESLKNTICLDEFQRQIAVQIPPGPQRIRGLAGTGKTVILCRKAAITLKDFTNYKILFLFNTKPMYQTIINFISEYYIRETGKQPTLDNIDIYHAWGGRDQEGLYSSICRKHNIMPLTFGDVRRAYDPLDAVYTRFLDKSKTKIDQIYDLVLIDEAQDFPTSVFETVYHLTKEPKRIVWAYDEFQTLKDLHIKEPEDLFGFNENNEPNMPNNVLHGKYAGGIEKDFILPNSYRNPAISLIVAHSFALGLYREAGKIDILEDKKSWEAIGYKVIEPENKEIYDENDYMKVIRPPEYSKNNLEKLLKKHNREEKEIINFISKETIEEELYFVKNEIVNLINNEKVDPSEIFVITLDTKNSDAQLKELRWLLAEEKIKSIMPGFIEDASIIKREDNVTLTTPFKAKGNESNIVFVLNSQQAYSNKYKRNALFVSITRSKGWCYIVGHGQNSEELQKEFNHILQYYPHIEFEFPTKQEIAIGRKMLTYSDKEFEQREQYATKLKEESPELILEKAKELLKENPDLKKYFDK